MGAILSWYLLVTLLGLAAWPLAFRLLPGLPDRGYTLSRALGLMLTGYVFWLLASLGLLRNTPGAMLFALVIVLSVAIWACVTRSDRDVTLFGWVRAHATLVVTAELLFVVAFVAWAVVRAYNPDLNSTEKPMELTFLNGIRGSDIFPPRDPWLSGYAISYYYFGYVIMAMLADLSNVITSVGFNLGIALLFALTLLGAYGLVYNLVALECQRREPEQDDTGVASATGLLGALFVGVMGNLEAALELVRSLHLSFVPNNFWIWLDIKDINIPLAETLWPPDRWRFWWWWRASRVIHDRDLAGVSIGLQPIDEFPMFSFLLGDMHPHVLALPFVLLALALALNALAQRESPLHRAPQFLLYALAFGGLAFLNTWDLPFYLFVLTGALVVRRTSETGMFRGVDLGRVALRIIGLAAVGVIAYLPWYISFSSQAGGILPNAIFPTRLRQFVVMFGPFLFIILCFLGDQVLRLRGQMAWGRGYSLTLALLLALVVITVGLSIVALRQPVVRQFIVSSAGLADRSSVEEMLPLAVRMALIQRLRYPWVPLLLVVVLGVVLARLLPEGRVETLPDLPTGVSSSSETTSLLSASTGFVLILILTGTLLTLGPEFVYLRDTFGQRFNTIFKFYYVTWVMFGIVSAYAVYALLSHIPSSPIRFVTVPLFSLLAMLLVMGALAYPSFAIPSKTGGFVRMAQDPAPTLDGIDYIRRQYPNDYNAILWLQQNAEPDAVVLEAVGGSYTYFGRISSTTGLPTLLGWPGHELQWRGTLELAGSREADVHEIYNTINMNRALELLEQYNVTYVIVGFQERNTGYASPAGLSKFERFLAPVFQSDDTVIYGVNQPLVEETP